jgi:micrococcal nuclease
MSGLSLLTLGIACTGGTATDTGGTQDSATTPTTDTQPQDTRPYLDPSVLAAGAAPCREPFLAFVDYVVDGDTAYLSPDGSSLQEKVRFIGIDTPELGWDGEPDDCYGAEALVEAERLIAHRWVWLTFDEECVDFYGRTLAYLHLGADPGDFVNRSLVQTGFAWAYAVEPNVTFENVLRDDETAANLAGAGLWSACAR